MKRLSQIDVADVHNASVILTGDPAMIYVGDDRFLPRLESYVELAAALRERVPNIDYVDLRFDDRIVRAAGGQAREERRGCDSAITGTDPEAAWRAKNGTWSGSTSARRR